MKKEDKELSSGFQKLFFKIQANLYTWIRIRFQNSDQDPPTQRIRIQFGSGSGSQTLPGFMRLRIRSGVLCINQSGNKKCLEEDDGVLPRLDVLKNCLEETGAGGQHDTVRFDAFVLETKQKGFK